MGAQSIVLLLPTWALSLKKMLTSTSAAQDAGLFLVGGCKHGQSAYTQGALCVFQTEKELTIQGENCYHSSAQICSVYSLNRINGHAD